MVLETVLVNMVLLGTKVLVPVLVNKVLLGTMALVKVRMMTMAPPQKQAAAKTHRCTPKK